MGSLLQQCYSKRIELKDTTSLKEIINNLDEEAVFYSKKLDYASRIEKDESKMDYIFHVETNLLTVINILKHKRGDDIEPLKERLVNYIKCCEGNDLEVLTKQTMELEEFLKFYE